MPRFSYARATALALFAALLAAPSLALAGGCPTCTSNDDCGIGGGPGFCVEWSRDFGCGAQRVACCPGQACAIEGGRPSCEGQDSDGDMVDDCRVFGSDAGAPAVDGGGGSDGGATGSDGGAPGTDAGPPAPGTDAGPPTPGLDAGPPSGMDAGPDGMDDGGCGCRVGARSSVTPLGVLALLGLALLRRRR